MLNDRNLDIGIQKAMRICVNEREISMNKKENKYPEYIMAMLRQRLDIEADDTSRDTEINSLKSFLFLFSIYEKK